jgi:hypothetical protein
MKLHITLTVLLEYTYRLMLSTKIIIIEVSIVELVYFIKKVT